MADTWTEADVATWHEALYKACGLEPIPLRMNHQREWGIAMQELEGLASTSGGPFTTKDIVAAVAFMKRQRNKGMAGWSLRPSNILRDPAVFCDVIQQARAELKMVKHPPRREPVPELPDQSDNSIPFESAAETFRKLKEQNL